MNRYRALLAFVYVAIIAALAWVWGHILWGKPPVSPDELAAICWANKNGMGIDSWQAGEIPGPDFDEQAWLREGRSIPDVENVLIRLLQMPSPGIEPILLVRGLGSVGTEKCVPVLIEQLEGKYEVTRHEAIWALGQIGGEKAERELTRQLSVAPTRGERRTAARALATIGDPGSIAALQAAIQGLQDEEETFRKEIATIRTKLTPDGRTAPPQQPDPSAQNAPASEPAEFYTGPGQLRSAAAPKARQ